MSTSMTLFGIEAEIQDLEDRLTAVGGEISSAEEEEIIDQWLSQLAGLTEKKLTKVDAYIAVISSLEKRAELRKDESKRIANKAQVDLNTAKRRKDRLKQFFQFYEVGKIETLHFSVSLVNNGGIRPLILKVAPNELPAKYQIVTMTAVYSFNRTIVSSMISPNNELIRSELEAGIDLPFAELQNRGVRLSIR